MKRIADSYSQTQGEMSVVKNIENILYRQGWSYQWDPRKGVAEIHDNQTSKVLGKGTGKFNSVALAKALVEAMSQEMGHRWNGGKWIEDAIKYNPATGSAYKADSGRIILDDSAGVPVREPNDLEDSEYTPLVEAKRVARSLESALSNQYYQPKEDFTTLEKTNPAPKGVIDAQETIEELNNLIDKGKGASVRKADGPLDPKVKSQVEEMLRPLKKFPWLESPLILPSKKEGFIEVDYLMVADRDKYPGVFPEDTDLGKDIYAMIKKALPSNPHLPLQGMKVTFVQMLKHPGEKKKHPHIGFFLIFKDNLPKTSAVRNADSHMILKEGVGYWDTTKYPIGGNFKRAPKGGKPIKKVIREFERSSQTHGTDMEVEFEDGTKGAIDSKVPGGAIHKSSGHSADDKPKVNIEVYTGEQDEVFLTFEKDANFTSVYEAMKKSLDSDLDGISFHRGFPRDEISLKLKKHHAWIMIKNWIEKFVKIGKVKEVKQSSDHSADALKDITTFLKSKDPKGELVPIWQGAIQGQDLKHIRANWEHLFLKEGMPLSAFKERMKTLIQYLDESPTVKANPKLQGFVDKMQEIAKRLGSAKQADVQDTSNWPDWLKKAKISPDAKIEIDHQGVRWHSGTWYEGEWMNGVWMGGTWKNGVWHDGTWKGGVWEKGTWKNGWHNGGTWKNGTWEYGDWYGGTWENGVWKEGVWSEGTWKKGTWRGGHWQGGTWESGTWEHGDWAEGVWHSGVWKDGTWHDGEWKGGTWNSGTWVEGVWKDGLWKDGRFEFGTWQDGTWENGVWVGGGIWNKGIWKGGEWKDKRHPAPNIKKTTAGYIASSESEWAFDGWNPQFPVYFLTKIAGSCDFLGDGDPSKTPQAKQVPDGWICAYTENGPESHVWAAGKNQKVAITKLRKALGPLGE